MVPVKKEDLRKLVTDTTVEIYEELTPQLVKLIQDTKKNTELTEGQKQDEISLHMMGYVKSCTNDSACEIIHTPVRIRKPSLFDLSTVVLLIGPTSFVFKPRTCICRRCKSSGKG